VPGTVVVPPAEPRKDATEHPDLTVPPPPHRALARTDHRGRVLLIHNSPLHNDGCANRFPDEAGWEGRCPECMALWDDHTAGQHDPPVDGCLLVR
jgi:hypothetical protein